MFPPQWLLLRSLRWICFNGQRVAIKRYNTIVQPQNELRMVTYEQSFCLEGTCSSFKAWHWLKDKIWCFNQRLAERRTPHWILERSDGNCKLLRANIAPWLAFCCNGQEVSCSCQEPFKAETTAHWSGIFECFCVQDVVRLCFFFYVFGFWSRM